jgi:hypothetical protein
MKRATPSALVLTVAALGAAAPCWPATASADAVAYLVNVTVRPGYNFPNADAALAYGHGVCDKISAGEPYARIVEDIKTDFNTSDPYQGEYLTAQAVNELCPVQIWRLRNSAAGYTRAVQ